MCGLSRVVNGMSKLVDTQLIFDEIWKLRRSQQLLDDTQKADLVMHGMFLVEKAIEELPSVQTREVECEKCYWSDEKGCSIFCRAWNRYTSHSGYCHQYADRGGDSDDNQYLWDSTRNSICQ